MLTLVLAATMLAAPVPKDTAPPGPPPRLLELQPGPDGKVRVQVMRPTKRTITVQRAVVKNGQNVIEPVQQEVTTNTISTVELTDVKDLSIWTADGKEADKAVAMKKLLEGGVVVASADGKKVDPKYLKLFRDDVLVIGSPELYVPGQPTPRTGVLPALNGGVVIQGGGNVQIQAVPLPAPVAPPPLTPLPPPPQKEKKEDKEK